MIPLSLPPANSSLKYEGVRIARCGFGIDRRILSSISPMNFNLVLYHHTTTSKICVALSALAIAIARFALGHLRLPFPLSPHTMSPSVVITHKSKMEREIHDIRLAIHLQNGLLKICFARNPLIFWAFLCDVPVLTAIPYF